MSARISVAGFPASSFRRLYHWYRRSVTLWSSGCRFPGAETTMHFLSGSARTMASTFLICSASATEVPPNFATFLIFFLSKNCLEVASDHTTEEIGKGKSVYRGLAECLEMG